MSVRIALGMCLFATACASSAEQGETSELARSAASSARAPSPLATHVEREARPLIVSVRLRDETLRVHSGARFSVERSDGTIVSSGMDLDQLAATHHDLYELYENAFARGGPWLDARK
jgi:hypothetical protein